VPRGVILKTVPLLLAPRSFVVPQRFPSVAWTRLASGMAPSVPSKLSSVVNTGGAEVDGVVCAGNATAAVAHIRKTAPAFVTTLSLPMLTSSPLLVAFGCSCGLGSEMVHAFALARSSFCRIGTSDYYNDPATKL